MAYPFDPVVFKEADALFVTTAAWKWGLEPYSPTNPYSRPLTGWYGAMSMKLPRLINIKQVLDERFLIPPLARDVTEARARMTFGRIIGFFGRIESNTYPTILTAAYQDLKKLLPDLQLVVAGTLRIPLPADVLLAPRIDYEKMPQFVKACIATASDEGDDAEFLGSGKVLDSVAAGVPIIAYKTPPRVEQLGEDYPLYYRDHAGAARRLMEAAFDRELMADVRKHLAARSVMFAPAARSLELKVEIESLLQASVTPANAG
jgi:glycosyltransferase involved in cell wall biosynthesis